MYYRILRNAEHVATVQEAQVEENLELYSAQLELDIDGNPIGEVTAEPFEGYVAGGR